MIGAGERRGVKSVRVEHLLALVLLSAVVNLPFVGQAFHIDDGVFLHVAENVSRNPLFSQDLPLDFEGVSVTDLASTEHPPLTAYFMALAAAIGGGFSEVTLHMAFLLFPAILAAAGYLLSCRFTASPVIATLAVLATPVVYVMSHTLMTDLPLLALWATAVAFFVLGTDSGRRVWLWAGVSAASLATLISYTGFCLVPLLAFYALLRRSRMAMVPALLPVVVFGAWLGLNSVHYERFVPAPLLIDYLFVGKVLAPGLVANKLIYALVILGGATLFPAVLWFLGTRRRIAGGLTVAVVVILSTGVREYDLPGKSIFAILFAAGFAGIWEIGSRFIGSFRAFRVRPRDNVDDLFLGIWFLGALAFCAIVYLTGSARYLLPAVLPFVLMMVRRAERLLGGKITRLAVPALLATASVALTLAVADFQFAGIYRDFAWSVRKRHPEPQQNLWFTGEWGFRTYLERLGGRELGRHDTRARPGDLLMVPRLATPYRTLFSDLLDLDSITMVTPCRLSFRIPEVQEGEVLTFTLGMPLYRLSDGLDFDVGFLSPHGLQLLRKVRLNPEQGRRWQVWKLSLAPCEGQSGSLVFSCRVGSSADVTGDWLAITRARISRDGDPLNGATYDLREHLGEAQIEGWPGVDYHTPGNRPVFPYRVWLSQEPAKILIDRREYRPATPIRLLDAETHAGFWSMAWGMLPYSVARRNSALESIGIYRITRRVDGYGESNPTWP